MPYPSKANWRRDRATAARWLGALAVSVGATGCSTPTFCELHPELCIQDAGELDSETGDGGDDDGHGTVRIEITPNLDDPSVFDGTTEVRVTVNYQSCLQEFYLITNPDMRQDRPEGNPIFAAAADQLCSIFENIPSCQITGIAQALLFSTGIYSLQVGYGVDDPATIAYREFHVGPIPTSELAGCDAGVELAQTGVVGYDQLGTQIWRLSTLPAVNVAVADQDTPLRVEAIRNAAPP